MNEELIEKIRRMSNKYLLAMEDNENTFISLDYSGNVVDFVGFIATIIIAVIDTFRRTIKNRLNRLLAYELLRVAINDTIENEKEKDMVL